MTGHTSAKRLIAAALLAVAVFGVPSTASAQSQAEVDRAEAELARAKARESDAFKRWDTAKTALDEAIADYTDINARREELTITIDKLEGQIEQYTTEADAADARAKALIIDAYTSGGNAGVETAIALDSIQDILLSQILLDEAAVQGLTDLGQLAALNREVDRLRINLSDQEAEALLLEGIAEDKLVEVQGLYAEADAAYEEASAAVRAAIDTVREEQRAFDIAEAKRKAEQAAAAYTAAHGAAAGLAPGTIPGFICPVQGGSNFINSWGYSRSGGTRSHKGTDMYSSTGYGHPLVAVQPGYIKKKTVNLGGIVVYLYDDAGYRYYYAHLQGYPDGLVDGQRVDKGQVIGYMGSSGNAGSPHLHFQIHPGGGAAVNPYPTVRAVC
ncbi:MAG: peptidoglycan DD-metalloendopeptidase family protein [Acidimicrobiia bacterium]|nr:peptidoglycan DD-metalloendopeptidase family protein [Acidimicrobiia bacterium]